jgi:hypothetical protein
MSEEIGAALSQGVTKLKFSKDGIAELNIDLPGNGSLYLVAEHKSPEDSPKTDIQVSMSKDNLSYKFMIDRILKRRGLNQTELAKILGVNYHTTKVGGFRSLR